MIPLAASAPEVLNPRGAFPCIVAVGHAGAEIPPDLQGLGLRPFALGSHHALDRGVAALARALAGLIDAAAILRRTSRLVIDCNRWLGDPRSILTSIDGEPVPGNAALSSADREARAEAVLWPHHRRLGALVAEAERRHPRPALLALHSFTRHSGGARRLWDAGTIWHEREAMSAAILEALGRDGTLTLGSNEPYSGRDGVYTVDRHSYGTGIRACGLEVADDLLLADGRAEDWGQRIAAALREAAGSA